MRPFIDESIFSLQVETNKELVAVPDGIAVSSGMYDKDLSFDLPPATVTPMGMNKNGNQTLPNRQWTNITGWVARSGFPGTVINNNGLVVAQTHRANISFKAFFSRPGGFAIRTNSQLRILINGIKVKESDVIFDAKAGGGAVVNAIGLAIDLNQGDIITVQAWTDFFTRDFFAETTILATLQSSSYLTFVQAKLGSLDFMKDLIFASETRFYESPDTVFVMPNGKLKSLPMNRVTTAGNGNAIAYQAIDVGPIIAQSKTPYPVQSGMLVNFGGTLKVRRSGNREKTEENNTTGLNVRFALWGKGKTSDEYGDNDLDIELISYESVLQVDDVGNYNDKAMITYTIPSMSDVVIPPDITLVYFVASLKQSLIDDYASASFDNTERAGINSAYFGTTYADPLYVKIQANNTEKNTYKHPLSATGVAMKNRKYFDNLTKPKELIFFGNNSSVSLNIYKSTNKVRGSLIGTYAAAAGERKKVVVESNTGQIELASANPYWVESCVPVKFDEFLKQNDGIYEYDYQVISDHVTNIKIERTEADASFMYVSFWGSVLDPTTSIVLKPGKKIRFLSKDESSFENVFSGIIKKIETKYNFDDEPYIKITVYDSLEKLDRIKFDYIYDDIKKYGPVFNSTGMNFKIDSVDYLGVKAEIPDGLLYYPSYSRDSLTLLDSVITSRNTNKCYLWCNRKNEIILNSNLSSDIKEVFSETSETDLSFSDIDLSSSTESIINSITVEELKFNSKEFNDQSVSSEIPVEEIEYIPVETKTAKFKDDESIDLFGEFDKNFEVVRGNGDLNDIINDSYGANFKEWALAILNKNNNFNPAIGSISTNPINKSQIKKISALDLLDLLEIRYKGNIYKLRIREIDHEISPGKWVTKFSFKPTGDHVYWLPETE